MIAISINTNNSVVYVQICHSTIHSHDSNFFNFFFSIYRKKQQQKKKSKTKQHGLCIMIKYLHVKEKTRPLGEELMLPCHVVDACSLSETPLERQSSPPRMFYPPHTSINESHRVNHFTHSVMRYLVFVVSESILILMYFDRRGARHF